MALVDYSSSDDGQEDGNKKTKSAVKVPVPVLGSTSSPTPTPAPYSILSPTRKRKLSQDQSSPSLLPPLPSRFHDLYASSTRPSTRDDPSLHGGRKRVTPHIEGNWPTHIYIEWYPTTTEHSLLTDLLANLNDVVESGAPTATATSADTAPGEIHSSLTSDLGAPLPLHISLSRSIGFLTEQKDAFATSLDIAIKSCGVRPFEISFTSLAWVPNFEKTRWFLVLRLAKPETDGLNRLLHVTNGVVERNGQPPLYASNSEPSSSSSSSSKLPASSEKSDSHGQTRGGGAAKRGRRSAGSRAAASAAVDWSGMRDLSQAFHFSIAWMLSAPSEELRELTVGVVDDGHFEDVRGLRVMVEEIKSKIGNVVTSLPLRKNQAESKGLFGL